MSATDWSETIELGQWKRQTISPLLLVCLVPAGLWLALAFGPAEVANQLIWPAIVVTAAHSLVLLLVVWYYLHRDDRIEFDAGELRLVSRGTVRAVPWPALDEAWIETNGGRLVRLRAGEQRCTIPLQRIENADTAQRLRECLAPIWERKLAAMAAGDARLPPPRGQHPVYFALGVVLWLALVGVGLTSTGTDRWVFTGFGGLMLLLSVYVLLFNRYAAGPDRLTIFGSTIALSSVR